MGHSKRTPTKSRKAASTASASATSPKTQVLGVTIRKPRIVMTREERFKIRFKTDVNSRETVRDLQVANWTSRVYEHFIMPPQICNLAPSAAGSERVGYTFFCKKHPSTFVRRERMDDCTSNLSRHVQKCEPSGSSEANTMEAFANGSTLSTGRLRFLLVKWITKNYRPFSIIEDAELQEILQMLDCRIQIPSRSTLSRDVHELFGVARFQVQNFFKEYQGKVHIGLDGWTSPNVFSYLGITVHYIHGCEMRTVILDFVKLTSAHDGQYLAQKLHECLVDYHLDTKLLGIVCDNASNNNTMIAALGDKMPSWGGSTMRVRCFAHILNLVVKSILSIFTIKRRCSVDGTEMYEDPHLAKLLKDIGNQVDEEDDNAYYEDDGDGRDSSDKHLIDMMEESEIEKEEINGSAREVRVAQVSLEKLKGLAKSIFHSPTLRTSLEEQCGLTDPPTPYRMLVRPVATRWNSLTMTIKSALALRPALTALVDLNVHNNNKDKATRLRRFTLDDDEWRILEELLPLLDRFLEATNIISVSSFPLIHSVIPLIDHLSGTLETWAHNATLHPAVRIASRRGWDLLNKYYGLTDDSVIYRIAMIMHPRRKLTYFRSAGWPDDWVQTSVELARNEWIKNYKPTADSQDRAEQGPKISSYFEDMNCFEDEGIDAFEQYITTPTVPITCPITYWMTLQQSGEALASMALDFLTCPAASTDVERAFSRGRLTVSRTRHSLSDESTRASTVLSSWFQHAHFIPEKNLVQLFGNKNARPQNGKVNNVNVEIEEDANGEITDVFNSMTVDDDVL